MKLDPKAIALLEFHSQATVDLLRVLADGAVRSTHAEIQIDITPGRPAKTRLLAELQPLAKEIPKASGE